MNILYLFRCRHCLSFSQSVSLDTLLPLRAGLKIGLYFFNQSGFFLCCLRVKISTIRPSESQLNPAAVEVNGVDI